MSQFVQAYRNRVRHLYVRHQWLNRAGTEFRTRARLERLLMHKIPIGQTIALAYRFLFSEIGTIIGICWFPALLSSLASYLTAIYAAMHEEQIEARELGPEAVYTVVSI